jgi:hypothetical protein
MGASQVATFVISPLRDNKVYIYYYYDFDCDYCYYLIVVVVVIISTCVLVVRLLLSQTVCRR